MAFGLGLLTGVCITCVVARWALQEDGPHEVARRSGLPRPHDL